MSEHIQIHVDYIRFPMGETSFPTVTLYLCDQPFKRLSQIVPGARTASKNYYLSHIILLTARAPGLICESPFRLIDRSQNNSANRSNECSNAGRNA